MQRTPPKKGLTESLQSINCRQKKNKKRISYRWDVGIIGSNAILWFILQRKMTRTSVCSDTDDDKESWVEVCGYPGGFGSCLSSAPFEKIVITAMKRKSVSSGATALQG
ncbi:hypothetical protein BJ165DRAFT_1408293 [Panaeolus papilionaceus]|nr:hypothetical protein BJ165DRAFT_1408293 [Panaeolus papilionaceus]